MTWGTLKTGLEFLSTRIGQRFLIIFLALGLLPLAIVGALAMRIGDSTVRQQTAAILRAASDGAEAQLREFLGDLKQETLILANSQTLRHALEVSNTDSIKPESRFDEPALSQIVSVQQNYIADAQEIFILDINGRVVASTDTRRVGRDLSQAGYFVRGVKSFYCGDVFRDPLDGKITWVLGAPIRDEADHHLLGVLAVRINPELLSALTTGQRILNEGADTQCFRIGNTGETYIVNRYHFMITESRFLSNSVSRIKVDTEPVRAAFDRGQEITANYRDYRGIEVSGASAILRDADWVLVTEVDFSQAFAPLHYFRRVLVAVSMSLMLLVLILAWSSTRRIIRPVQLLQESDRALAIGDEKASLVSEASLPYDELGELVHRRNSRVERIFAYQRQLENQATKLRDALTELEHMSYSITHNMRAPLRAMKGFAEIIINDLNEHGSEEDRKRFLQRIITAADRMDQLITDALRYGKAVQQELPLKPVNIGRLLEEIVDTYPEFQAVAAEITLEPGFPQVIGNEAALTECFSNLLTNAVKFAKPGVTVRVRVWGELRRGQTIAGIEAPEGRNQGATGPRDEWLRIWIEDNGIGISSTMLPRIFDLFSRGPSPKAGTGIGLALVRKIVERMGGHVGVESEVGKGSRFWVELKCSNN